MPPIPPSASSSSSKSSSRPIQASDDVLSPPQVPERVTAMPPIPSSASSSSRKSAFRPIRASNDVWDVPAVLLLLQEYEARKALFNSVSGTNRLEDLYKLLSRAMALQGRNFTWEECTERMNALNDTFYLACDFAEFNTGEGGLAASVPFYEELARIHEGSTAIEAPVTYSFGASHAVKRGNVLKVKEVSSKVENESRGTSAKGTRPAKGRRSWDWKSDPALTQRQQSFVLQQQKIENQRLLLEELKVCREMREREAERKAQQ